MIDERSIELINKEIDGIISEEEKNDLQQLIQENTEARQFYKNMLNSFRLVNNVGEVEPSLNLKKRIMNSIDPDLYKEVKKKPAFISNLSNIFVHPKPRLAFAFVTGVLLGALIYALLFSNIQQRDNNKDLYGTIGIESDEKFAPFQDIPIEFDEIQGSINVKQLDNIYSFHIDLSTSENNNVLLEFIPEELKFNTFSPQDLNKYSIESNNNFIKISSAGNNKFFILFNRLSDDSTNINIKIFLSGKLFFGTKVALTKNK